MHKIQDRPCAINESGLESPMMYLALPYDLPRELTARRMQALPLCGERSAKTPRRLGLMTCDPVHTPRARIVCAHLCFAPHLVHLSCLGIPSIDTPRSIAAIVSCMRNRGLFISTLLAYHSALGFDHCGPVSATTCTDGRTRPAWTPCHSGVT